MVVVDNNVLSSLAKIQHLDYLPQIFDNVGTVSSVFDELHQDAVAGYEFVERIDAVKAYQSGWLEVHSITEPELQLADDIADSTLAFTDAECIAVASNRNERLLTDDGHAGEMAAQRGVEVWDLKLLLEAALVKSLISSESELSTVIDALREQDGYRFSEGPLSAERIDGAVLVTDARWSSADIEDHPDVVADGGTLPTSVIDESPPGSVGGRPTSGRTTSGDERSESAGDPFAVTDDDEPRTERAKTEDMDVSLLQKGGIYEVHSASDSYYDVDVAAEACSCPDTADRCKHLRRVALEIKAGFVPRPDGRLPEGRARRGRAKYSA